MRFRSIFSRLVIINLVAVGISAASAVKAADTKGLYSVHGIGSFKCADVVKLFDTNGPDKITILSWIDGNISAVNKYEKETFDLLAMNDPPLYVPNLIINYCRQNPDKLLDTSTQTVLNVLKPARIKQSSEFVALKSDKASVTIPLVTLKAVEQKLIKLTYFKGQPQGKFSDDLTKAIFSFQTAKRMTVTGLPDAETVFKILLES